MLKFLKIKITHFSFSVKITRLEKNTPNYHDLSKIIICQLRKLLNIL